MTLQFYRVPGSCSTGIHILLEALDVLFQVTSVNLPAGDHRQPAYLALEPKAEIAAPGGVFKGHERAAAVAGGVQHHRRRWRRLTDQTSAGISLSRERYRHPEKPRS